MSLRLLVVARWYPSHDDPGRGSFVADLVQALAAEGVDIMVASFEDVPVRGSISAAGQRVARAARSWVPEITAPDALNRPVGWGAGVPVARLPAFRTANESVERWVSGHASLLVPFGVALHGRWPFELIHAHTGLPDGLAALDLARALGLPLVVTEHDSSLRRRLPSSTEARSAYRNLLRRADAMFAVSEHFRTLLAGWLGLPEGVMDVLANPVPAVFFDHPLDEPRDPEELLYVGARKASKGVPVLLEALALVRADRPEVHLRLIGRSETPQDEARWQDMAGALGLAESVSFDPPRDRTGVAAAMRRAGAFMHPSPFESFGLVAAEALACGLPVATTRSGIEEIVGRSGELGEVASGTDAESLADAVLRVLDARAVHEPQRLREYAREHFAAKTIARRTVARYREVLDARASRLVVDRGTMTRTEPSLRSRFQAPIVLGFNRTLAGRRIAVLPRSLADGLILVTDVAPEGRASRPSVGHVIEVDLLAAYRANLAAAGGGTTAKWDRLQRAWHFLLSPRAALRRRRIRRSREAMLLTAAERAVIDAWRAAQSEGGKPPRLMPIDGNDLAAAEAAISLGARLTPGSTRWLADLWDETKASGS